MIQITRRLEFDAGHRLLNHEGRCRHLHGHRYSAEITCQAEELDGIGRVIDFSVIKTQVGGWIDQAWDHNMILHFEDPLLDKMVWATSDDVVREIDLFGRIPYVMDCNPTAENMAKNLFASASNILRIYNIKVVHVRLYETPNCWADYGNDSL